MQLSAITWSRVVRKTAVMTEPTIKLSVILDECWVDPSPEPACVISLEGSNSSWEGEGTSAFSEAKILLGAAILVG